MAVERIGLHMPGGYIVTAGEGLLSRCGEMICQVISPCSAAVVADSNVARLYLPAVESSLKAAGYRVLPFVFPAGENSKTLSVLEELLEFLAESQLTRSDLVVALGGGVCGDLAGFAAAVYLRGIGFVQMPTTLLAAVDSSVGGKTGVNLSAGKNLAGVIRRPLAVICDTDCLSTLSPEVFSDGMAEVIKYGVLRDRILFDLTATSLTCSELGRALPKIIRRCVSIKGEIVEADESEQRERRLLNLGHTIGHAIEKCSGYRVFHGHAVAAGMAMIARAGEKTGITEIGTADEIENALVKNHLPVTTAYTPEQLLACALSDKKRRGDRITIVVPKKVGECRLLSISLQELPQWMELGWEAQR